MILNVPYNWDLALLDNLKPYKENIGDFYACLPSSIVGNLRHQKQLPNMDFDKAKEHIKGIKDFGARFGYIANSLCLGNREYTQKKEIYDYFEMIAGLNVDKVVIGNPFLVEFLKKHFPQLKIKLSLSALLDSYQKIKIYKDKVETISLPDLLNRDFRILKEIASLDMDFELLLNNICLLDCPLIVYHGAFASHNSQIGLQMTRDNFPMVWCTREKIKDPMELLKSPWIRPEDIEKYENLGFKYFKIAGREYSTDWITQRVRIYSSRKYDGNALDFLNVLLYQTENKCDIYIDNSKLNGFLDIFIKGGCTSFCLKCKHCEKYLDKAISFKGDKEKYINDLNREIDRMVSLQ